MKFDANLVRLLIGFSILAALAACGAKNNDDKRTTTPYVNSNFTNTGSYTFRSDGQCYSKTGQVVATSYCNTSGFTMNGQYCYSSTGQVVDNSYCTNNSNNLNSNLNTGFSSGLMNNGFMGSGYMNTMGGYGQQCYGVY